MLDFAGIVYKDDFFRGLSMNLEDAAKQYLSLETPVLLFDKDLALIGYNDAAQSAARAVSALVVGDVKAGIADRLARFSTARLSLSHFPGLGDEAMFIKTDFGSAAIIDRSARETVSSLPYALDGADLLGENIRTGLEGVLLGSAALERHFDSDDPEVEGMFERVRKSAYGILRAVTNATLVSSWLGGSARPRKAPVDIVERVGALCEAVRAVSTRHIALGMSFDAGSLVASVDGDMFDRALLNLILNAVRYGAESDVRVRVTAAGGRVCVSVSDGGYGMELDDMARAHEPYFSREPGAPGRERSGLGLGLAVAEAFCTLHGGSLVLSGASGEGATATLTFEPGQADDCPELHLSAASYISDLRSRVYVELCDICALPS